MIRASRHMDLETAPIRLAAVVLEEIGDASALRLDDLRSAVSQRVRGNAKTNLSVALQLLFLMGMVDYDPSTDAILRLPDEAVE